MTIELCNLRTVTIGVMPSGTIVEMTPEARESDFHFAQRCARARSKHQLAWDQDRQNKADDAMDQSTMIHVSRLTPTQSWLIEDELNRTGTYAADAGRTFLWATRGTIFSLAEGLESTWPDEDELRMRIEGGANKDLTEAQVNFGIKQQNRSMRLTVKKMLKAARKS